MSHCQSGNPEVSSLENDKTSKNLVTTNPKENSRESTEQEKSS